MKKQVRIPMIKGQEKVKESVKIVESSKKKGNKVSLAVKVDDGFIFNLLSEKDYIGNFIDLELNAESNILILHFERRDVEKNYHMI